MKKVSIGLYLSSKVVIKTLSRHYNIATMYELLNWLKLNQLKKKKKVRPWWNTAYITFFWSIYVTSTSAY